MSAAHKLGDAAVEMLEIPGEITGTRSALRIERYELIDGDLRLKDARTRDTSYSVLKQKWFTEAMQSVGPQWFNLTSLPGGDRLAVALAGPIDIDQKRQGVLGIIIELTRVSRFLSQLTVGKSAGAFILDRGGAAIASPDPDADEVNALKTNHPLFPVAVTAVQQSAASYEPDRGDAHRTRVVRTDQAYEVVLTPISFPGWSLVTVVPESEFLGPVRATIRRLLMGLAVLIVAAGLFSAWFAQRLIAGPLIKVVNEIRHVERFDLEKVERHPSRLTEIENLPAPSVTWRRGSPRSESTFQPIW